LASSIVVMQHNTQPDHPGETNFDRRRALRLLGGTGLGLGVAGLVARGVSAATLAAATDSTIPTATDEIPDETGGPYPGDGTNGPNVLADDGVVRSDITSSFGSATGVADGIPLQVVLNVQDVANGGNPLAGAAVYLWHCDAEGRYSLYSEGATEENYLRGVQEVDAAGNVTFATIYPGCYSGRWPHIHFEVYKTLEAATSGRNAIKTSQLAFPQGVSETVYADDRYPVSIENLDRISLESDMVFGEDSAAHQMAIMTGDNEAGYTAVLAVGI
jgi:protocatechuate 3,4-dioxygenase beta subunit